MIRPDPRREGRMEDRRRKAEAIVYNVHEDTCKELCGRKEHSIITKQPNTGEADT